MQPSRLFPVAAICAGLGAACCLSSGHLAVAAQPSGPIKQTLQKLYAAGDAASERRDIDGMLAYYAPTFVFADAHGRKADLATFKASLAQVIQAAQSVTSKSVVQTATAQGKTAVAGVMQDTKITLLNQQTGQPITLAVHAVTQDSWIRTAAGWRETASKTISETDTLNGKAVDLSAPSPSPPAVVAPNPAPAPAAPPPAPAPAPPPVTQPNTPAAPAAPDTNSAPAVPAAPPATAAPGS